MLDGFGGNGGLGPEKNIADVDFGELLVVSEPRLSVELLGAPIATITNFVDGDVAYAGLVIYVHLRSCPTFVGACALAGFTKLPKQHP